MSNKRQYTLVRLGAAKVLTRGGISGSNFEPDLRPYKVAG